MAAADYRLMTEATGQRIAIALENLAGFGNYLTSGDVVNNLTIDDTTGHKPAGHHEVYQLNTYTKGIAGLQSGANHLGNIMCAGYNTGSGNYISVFIPVNTNGMTVSSVTASSSESAIFDGTGRQLFTSALTINILETTQFGIRIEIRYESTKTPNIIANAYLAGLTINCT